MKLYADGALGSRGAALLSPYSDDPGNTGLLVSTPEHLRDVSIRALKAGFQVATHAIGDRGNRIALDAYEAALRAVPTADHCFRIEHAQILNWLDIPRFAQLGVIPSMQAVHATSDMYWAADRLGPSRILGAYAWRSLLNTGVIIPNGSDMPVERVNPLYSFHAAVTRQDERDWPAGGWHPEQCMTRDEALRSMTLWPAYAGFQEHDLGTLTTGKYADFVVLDRDIMTVGAPEILRTRVLATYVGGKRRVPGDGAIATGSRCSAVHWPSRAAVALAPRPAPGESASGGRPERRRGIAVHGLCHFLPPPTGSFSCPTEILVTDDIDAEGVALLAAEPDLAVDEVPTLPRDELLARIGVYDALVGRSATRISPELLRAAPRLAVVGRAGVGVDNIAVDLATEMGIAVINAPAGNSVAVAELFFGTILGLLRHIPQADQSMHAGAWDRSALMGSELRGRTLGIVGLGRIGGEIAARAHAFAMPVVAYDPYVGESRFHALRTRRAATLDELLGQSLVLTVHTPLTDETRGMIGARELGRLTPGALVANLARGGIIDERALAEALGRGHLAGAALDVYASEPLGAGHALRSAPHSHSDTPYRRVHRGSSAIGGGRRVPRRPGCTVARRAVAIDQRGVRRRWARWGCPPGADAGPAAGRASAAHYWPPVAREPSTGST